MVENPKNLKFKELEAAQLPRSLADVDLAVITMNYVMSSGMDVKKQGLFWQAATPLMTKNLSTVWRSPGLCIRKKSGKTRVHVPGTC